MNTQERYLLSDLGIVSALGSGAAATLAAMDAGDTSGLRPIQGLPDGDSTCFGFVPDAIASPEAVARSGYRLEVLLDEAMRQLAPALEELLGSVPAERMGVVVGTSNSTMEEFTDNPLEIDMSYPARRIAARWGLRGPAWSVSTACSSSAKAFASARRLLSTGLCDAVVVGGADAYTRTVVGGFHALEALSPAHSRPLAADRDGLSLGEGAAFFILRRPRPGEGGIALLGVGESSDAHHLTAPDPEGRGAEEAMRRALADAGLPPGDIDYVNLHGTGTVYNDLMECTAVRRVFGDGIPCSSTKPLTGHCLGAAGAIEAALCFLALRRGWGMPPHVSGPADRSIAPFPLPLPGNRNPLRTALSNSFAFGGSNASLILGSLPPES